MSDVRRHAITGGPGTGKSTLLAELERCGIATIGEVARNILQAPGGIALRVEQPLDFALAMLEAQRKAWDQAESNQPTVCDRGFPDTVGFLRLEGLKASVEVDRACFKLRFSDPIFFAPP